MERLGIDLPTPQQKVTRYLKSLDRIKNERVLAGLTNKALRNPDNTCRVDLYALCDLATNWINSSVGVRKEILGGILDSIYQYKILILQYLAPLCIN